MGSDALGGDRQLRVFVASTFVDNVRRRRVVDEAVHHAHMTAVGMEWFTASANPTVSVCIEQVRSCDLFVGIIAHRYGWIPPGHALSITELEYDAAVAAGIPRLMFLLDESVKVDVRVDFDDGDDKWDKQERLAAFKAKAARDQTATPFRDDNLGTKVLSALTNVRRESEPASKQGARAKARDDGMRVYFDALDKEHGSVRPIGFGPRVQVPIDLDDIFVPLHVLSSTRGELDELGDAGQAEANLGRVEDEQPISMLDALRRAERTGRDAGVMILGDPGAGKTTLLRHLALCMVREGPSALGLEADMIPVFSSWRALRDDDADLDTFVTRSIAQTCRGGEQVARTLLARGHLLFLLDGLDEIPDLGRRAEVLGWIDRARVRYPRSRFAITCRYSGYQPREISASPYLLQLHLRPLDHEQTRQFIHRWYRAIERGLRGDRAAADAEAEADAQALWAKLRGPRFTHARVFALTRNPLLLTAICLVFRSRKTLPERRVELYEECTRVLLEQWRNARGASSPFVASEAEILLQPMAYWLHAQRRDRRAPMEELAAVLEPELQRRWNARRGHGPTPSASEFLAVVRDESGLLTRWADGSYGFLHLGLQEYLAARQIARRVLGDPGLLGRLAERFGDGWWREVMLLLVSMRQPSLFGPLMKQVVARAEFAEQGDWVEEIVAEASEFVPEPFVQLLAMSPSHDEELWRRQLMAWRVLALEQAPECEQLREQLAQHPFDELRRLVRGSGGGEIVWSRRGNYELVKIPGGTLLMGSPEHDMAATAGEKPQHEVKLNDFAVGRNAVTNAQYREFLVATSHREPAFWADSRFNGDQQPVVGVSWHDARAFCSWAGLTLPKEAQWEYACRAGTCTRYASGDDEAELDRVAWHAGNSGGRLHAVGQKEPNALGLYDVHGNTFEWCEDTWVSNYQGIVRRSGDGLKLQPFGEAMRVIRGGSFVSVAQEARSAARDSWHPDGVANWIGFRPVLNIR